MGLSLSPETFESEEKLTYEKAGVSLRKEDATIKQIAKVLEKTFKFRKGKRGKVLHRIGHFANLLDLGGDYALAITMDGVGSKVLVAQELNRYDTIGIDLVAMNVNDLLCVGAEPVAMVDYIAFAHPNPEVAREIAMGLYEGAKEAGIAIVGGETASLPEIITGVGESCFDLVGSAVGFVRRDRILTGEDIRPGDVVLAFRSSGIHSNGLTLARKVLPKSMWIDLLKPTRIYVRDVLPILKRFKLHAAVHITGGGLLNLTRLTECGFLLDGLPEPQPIFKRIQELGNIEEREMYRTFNMGVGFCLITSPRVATKLNAKFPELLEIGRVVEEKGVRVVEDGTELRID